MAELMEAERTLVHALILRLDRAGEQQPSARSLRRVPAADGTSAWVSCLQAVEGALRTASAARDSFGDAGNAVFQRMLVLVCYFVAPYGLVLLRV